MRAQPDFDVIIAGAGFSGLGMAIALKREGKRSFVVLEKADSVGGTWRDNRYPGCACDIASALYSFSFAQNPDWSRLFPTQPEIRAYLEACTDRYGVRDDIRFNTAVSRAAWDDAAQLWRIETSAGHKLSARVFVSGMGGLHVPNLPTLPGMERFSGESWHSASWPESASLHGKRVALVGTGASAIQITPEIAPVVAKLDLYQRTPPWIVPRRDRAIPDSWKNAFRRAPLLQRLLRMGIYGLYEARAPAFLRPTGGGIGAKIARAHLERQVPDPALRAKLTPAYRMGCKRVLISDDYYPTLQHKNVELFTSGAHALSEHGVIDGEGVERATDVIVYATGFKPMDLISHVTITGVGGRSLNAEWAEGPQGYLGTVVSGYPNFFTLMGPNSGLGHNSIVYIIESQIRFIMDALAQIEARNAAALDVKPEAQRTFNAELQRKLAASVWGSGCQSWYLSADGQNHTLWPDFSFKFRALTKRIDPAVFAFS